MNLAISTVQQKIVFNPFKLSTHDNDQNLTCLIVIPRLMMTNLPEPVSEMDIMEMFSFADKNNDGKISWEEFLVFILY